MNQRGGEDKGQERTHHHVDRGALGAQDVDEVHEARLGALGLAAHGKGGVAR